MQQQQPFVKIQQQVFATAAHTPHPAPLQQACCTAQGPAQGFSHAHTNNLRILDTVCKTQTGDFDFR